MNTYFLIQAQNNAWANFRLGNAYRDLSPSELAKTCTGFFPSLAKTLNHILIVDWFYVSALEGQCMGLAAFEKLVPFSNPVELFAEQRKIDQRLVDVCRDPEKACGDRSVELIRGTDIQTERFDRTFLHLIQHQIHHRGQVHNMLSGTSVTPPQLDEFFLAGKVDKARRANDLRELGMSEQDVWADF